MRKPKHHIILAPHEHLSTKMQYIRPQKSSSGLSEAGTKYTFAVFEDKITVTRTDQDGTFAYDFRVGQRYVTWKNRLVEIVDLKPAGRAADVGKGYYPRARFVEADGTLSGLTDVSLANQIDIIFASKEQDIDVGTEKNASYLEGKVTQVLVNRYERCKVARHTCISHYGCKCQCCGFDFERAYGALGVGFIEVHHLTPLSEISAEYKVDPIKDLVPLCANCHRILHRSGVSFEDLKNVVRG